ncbi:MAG: hypothetical protein Q9170_007096 [Blastenia crenularia]
MEIHPIKEAFEHSLSYFAQVLREMKGPYYAFAHDVPVASWRSERGRLHIWARNTGALQIGQASLDFALRDASHISSKVLHLLQGLDEVLDEVIEYIADVHGEAPQLTRADSDDDHSNKACDDNDPTDDDSITTLQSYYKLLVTIIQCLFGLSTSFRNPAQHDFLVRSDISDTAGFEFYDTDHVRNEFPSLNEGMIVRLGSAMTRRRRYFIYRRRLNIKTRKDVDEAEREEKLKPKSLTPPPTLPTDYRTKFASSVDDLAVYEQAKISYEHLFFNGDDGFRVPTMPPLPREGRTKEPFWCPYCFCCIVTPNTRSWVEHVYYDLRPYSCPFEGCRWAERLYVSQQEWSAHMSSCHDTNTLECPLCSTAQETREVFELHLANHLEKLALFTLPRRDGEEDEIHEAIESEEEEMAAESDMSSESSVAFEEAPPGASNIIGDVYIPPAAREGVLADYLKRTLGTTQTGGNDGGQAAESTRSKFEMAQRKQDALRKQREGSDSEESSSSEDRL